MDPARSTVRALGCGRRGRAWRLVAVAALAALLLMAGVPALGLLQGWSGASGAGVAAAAGLDTIETYRARVIEVGPPEQQDYGYGMIITTQEVRIRLASGPLLGTEFVTTHANPNDPAYDITLTRGMELVVSVIRDETGEVTDIYIEDIARDRPLIWLAVGFVALLVVVGGLKGLRSAITLGVTLFAVFRIMLPALLRGANPITVSIGVAIGATLVTLTAVGGPNRKTLAAILGTTGGVLAAGGLAIVISSAARLTGFGAEEMRMLVYVPQGTEFNIRGLLFAGMLIGALGAVMDVGMSVASAMAEVQLANPAARAADLVRAGMNVGRDVMGTMANTLVLAYIGATIPLLLLFMAYELSFIRLLSLDVVATEVARALTGSIGLVLAIPLTALAGGALLRPVRGARHAAASSLPPGDGDAT